MRGGSNFCTVLNGSEVSVSVIRSQRVKGIINCSFKISIDAEHSCVVDVLTWFFCLSRSVLYRGLAFPSPSFVFSSSRSFHPWLPLCFSCFKSQDIFSVKINLLKSDPTFFPRTLSKCFLLHFPSAFKRLTIPLPSFSFSPVESSQMEQILPKRVLMMKQIREPPEKSLAASMGCAGQD